MSKLCVGPSVINSKQFKDTQTRYDLHESELEQIVHEWINIEGNEESFPTDDFIQSRIEGSPLLEASNEQILLWQRDYSTHKYFDSYEEASNQKAYASKFFGSDSIRILRAENGKYKVVVSQPVKYADNPSMINTLKRKAYNDIIEFSNRLGFEVKTQEEGDVVIDFANKVINISEVDSHTFNEIQAKVAAVLMPNELRSELLEVGKKYGRGSTEFIYQDILNAIENRDSWLSEEPTLFNKIKQWISSLIQKITKNQSYYESLIDKAAKDVTNPYSQWYRQVIQEGFSQKTLSMEKFKESPLFNVYQALTSLGAALDGSAAVRMQGTLFRKGEEEFHDLDFSKKFDAFSWDVKTELDEFFNNYKSATNNFTNKDTHIWKDLRQQMLDNCTEHLKRSPIYKELSKYYSDIKVKHASKSKELGLLVTLEIDGNPVDIFYGQNPIMHDIDGFKVADFSSSFSAKLIMGRDKDIRDIINFQKFGKRNTLSTNVSSLKNMVEDVNRGRFLMQTEAQKAAEAFNRGLSYGTYTTNYKEVNQGLSSPRYIVSEVNKYNRTHADKLRFNKRTQLVEPVNNLAVNAFDKPIERIVTEKVLERKITTEEMLEEGRQRDLVDYPFEGMDRGTPYMRGNAETFDNNADKHQYVRLDNDFRNSILQHLRNDVFKGSKLSNSTLENLAKALFDYFDRNGIQVLVVNKPADEASKGICSTASKALNQGVIFFQRQKGDNDYLVLLHELLHLATTDSLSFDSERKYLKETSQANKDLNNYFSAFVAQLENNAQYKYYRNKIMQAKTQEDLNAVPRWALDLYHATESVGEFLSCTISYESVQNELAKINVNNKSLIERIKDWMVDFVNKLFSIGKINAEVVTKDIVNFLMTTNIDNVQTSMASYMLEPAEFQAYVEQQQNQNAELWNSSLTYSEFKATKAIRAEMNAIKQQAIADGTFMKAPNGKQTNLTERQWLQVRTKAFLNWFGDWLTWSKLKNATVIWAHPASGKTYLHKQGRKDIIDFDSEYKVRINKIMGLPEGTDAKELRKAARKERSQEYHDLIMSLFDEAVAEAKRTGKKLLVSDMMLLREREADIDAITNMSDSKFIERSAMRGETDAADKMLWKNDINDAMNKVSDKSKIINTENFLLDDLDGINVSKVVDKNGEPLVVYHASKEQFNTFDKSKIGSGLGLLEDEYHGFYFTSNPNIKAKNTPVLYGVFLNARQIGDDRAVAGDEFIKENLNIQTVDEFQQGNDAIIQRNRIGFNESDGKEHLYDEIIVFNPNQIKSATDNIGTFSGQYNSINRGKTTIIDIQGFSGAAEGSDRAWRQAIEDAGGKVKDYTGDDYRSLTPEWRSKIEQEYLEARRFIGRPPLQIKDINNNKDQGILTRRDMMQADKADAVFAIAQRIVKPGEMENSSNGKSYPNNTGHDNVQGGTGNAVARGIIRGIPVYVFDQSDGKWKMWNYETRSFTETQTPILTKKAATIGTRGIDASGLAAIQAVIQKTADYNSKIQVKTDIPQRKSLDIVKANETAKRAKEIGGIDTLRHPNAQGMHFGNPFTYLPNEVAKGRASVFQPTIRENVDSFEKWLRGTAFQDVEPERRQWIIDQINSGALDNVPLVYYTTGARDTEGWHDYDYDTFPNHAHILLKLINEHIARKDEAMKGNELPEVKPVRIEIKDLNEHQKRFMEKQTKYLKQNMALEEAGLTTSEISEFAESIGFALSDYITWALEGKMEENGLNKEWVFDAFPEIAPSDPAMRKAELEKIRNMGRREFVEYIGVPTLFNAVQQKYEGWDMNAIDMFMKVDAIKDNWDTVMRQAAITFNDNEDFSLVLVSEDEVKEQKNVENPDVDNYNDSNQESFIEDNGGDALESWQVSENTTDKFTQISKLIKRELSSYLELDAEGNPVINVWGHQKRISLRPSVEQIYNFTEGCRDINEMVSMLESHLGEAPWITQLLSKLKDTSGKEAMFQSQFYVTFKQSTNVYSKGLTQKGKYATLPVNRHPALNKVMRSLRTTFELGEHSLFTQKGVDKSGLELLEKNFGIFTNNLQQDGSVEARNASLRTMVQLLVGETESAEVLTDFDNNNITLDTRELATITNALNNIIETLKVEVKKGNNYYNPLNTSQGSNGIYGRLQQVFTPFLKKSESEISSTAYSNGKTYQTHVTPSWLSLFIERVTAEDGVDYIEQHYGASEFFKLNGTYRNWILKQFMSLPENERAKMFQHHVEVEFNKKSYMRDMTSSEYMLSIATNYFANQREGIANYPMPMLGNKPSNEFISLPKIGGVFKGVKRSNYYTDPTIRENDVDVFLGEKSDNPEIASKQLPMRLQRIEGKQGGRTGTNLEMWIDNVLIKEAAANPSKTYKIRLDGFNDDNGLMTQMTMLNFLFERNIPSNIKISEYDLDKVVSQKQIEVIDALMDNFNQELSRIQTVMMREQAGIKKGTQGYIKHWDARGKEFQFLTIFNSYLNNNTEFGRELMNKLNGRPSNTYLIDSEARKILLKDMLQRTEEIMNNWERNGLLQAMMKINGIAENVNVAKQQFREMIWNYKMVETNLLQLLAVDKAFFKNEEDLQKRMPQVHAPGARVNKWSNALNGRNNIYSVNGKVSADGLARTAMLNDIEGKAVKSNMLENIKEVFDRKLSTLDPNSEQYRIAKAQYDEIYRNFKEKIVLTDAQAYRSVTGLRKVAHMLGRWDEEKEVTYQKIVSGNYDFTDVQALSQVIKPFVFTHMMESTEVADAPIKTMPVPMQNKNSEYLIILADAILQGEKTKRPNLLKVLNRIMEESAYTGRTYDADWNVTNQGTYNGKGIDVIQFVSAVKCGEKGALNLTSFVNMEEKQGEMKAYAYMKSMLYQQDAENNTLQSPETYNRNSVREFDFDNWCEQQTVDDHFLEHSQIDGSQKRAIIESDLETVYTDGTPVVYTFMDNGQKKMLNAEMFRVEYEQVYAQKIEYGIQRLADEFNLNLDENGKYSRVDRNIAVSEMLQKEVMNNLSRYGLDMLQAVSLDENYEFVLPLGDPIMYKRIEQLLNSMIKNRINKQMIEGGPVVQVSNFGTTTELSTRFQDRNGNVLPTLKEYQEAHPEKTVEDYKNDVLKNQAGMAYMEVFCSIYDESLLKFMNKDGIIDVKEIEKKEPELLKLISYRIPTEDKYSILPLKIVGFLPREAGAAIMFPADITLITGSDFDVDKMYLQRKSFYWKMDTKRFKDDAHAMLKESFKDMKGKDRADNINMFLDNPEYMKTVDEVQAKLYELYTKNDYRTEIEFPNKGEKYLDNKMIDMTWSVLTNESTLDKMLNPGGFEREKLMGYKVAAFQTGEFENWSDMDNYSVDDLKAIIDKNKKLDLTWIDTQITFYEQNNAASTALGMAAVQKSAHALLESDNIKINTSLILNTLPEREFNVDFLADFGISTNDEQLSGFLKLIEDDKKDEAKSKYADIYEVYEKANVIYEVTEDEKGKSVGRHSGTYMKLGNTVIGGNILIDGRADQNGILIGRTLGEFVAMFADAVKDPVANLMNINSQTMPVITTLIRLGVSFEDAAMFLSQPIIKQALNQLNYMNITGNYTTLNKVINKMIEDIDKVISITSSTKIQSEPLTINEMIVGLQGKATNEIKYKVLNMLKNVMLLSNEMKSITTATRVNSIAAAAGPLIIDNYLFQNKLEDFSPYFLDARGNELELKDLYDMHPMLSQFAQPFYGHNLVDKVFDYSPVNREFLDKCSRSIPMGRDKIFANRGNLSSFVDFAYSYMAAKAGIVESGREKLDYYINKFPSEFIMNNYKAMYPDNAFVQSIYREMQDVGDGTKMQVLSIGYTSLDEAQKQKLRNGWYDLHKENPKLAKDLFNYWFFRGGMTFNPRSAMALLPQQLRSIYYQYTDSKGNQRVLYRDRFEEVDYMTMLRQFFQNNAGNYSLVPVKKIDAGDIITISSDMQSLQGQFKNVRSNSGTVYAIKGNSKSELFNVPAFRTENDTKSLYFCIGQKKVNTEEGQEMCYIYEKVNALGNNNKYLEIDMAEIQEAMKVTDITEVEIDTEVNPNIESEIDNASKVEESVDNLDNPETRKVMSDMAENIAKQSSMTEQPMNEAEKVKQIGQSIIQEEQLSINFDDVQENMNKQEQC